MRSMYPRHGNNPRPGGRCGRQGVPHFEARVPCLLGNGVFPSHLFHFWNKTHILIKFRGCVYYIMNNQGAPRQTQEQHCIQHSGHTLTNTPHSRAHPHVTPSHPHAFAPTHAQTLMLTHSDTHTLRHTTDNTHAHAHTAHASPRAHIHPSHDHRMVLTLYKVSGTPVVRDWSYRHIHPSGPELETQVEEASRWQ